MSIEGYRGRVHYPLDPAARNELKQAFHKLSHVITVRLGKADAGEEFVDFERARDGRHIGRAIPRNNGRWLLLYRSSHNGSPRHELGGLYADAGALARIVSAPTPADEHHASIVRANLWRSLLVAFGEIAGFLVPERAVTDEGEEYVRIVDHFSGEAAGTVLQDGTGWRLLCLYDGEGVPIEITKTRPRTADELARLFRDSTAEAVLLTGLFREGIAR